MNGLYTYFATALIAASLAATGVWKVQDWRYGAKEKERAEQQLENERVIARAALRNQERVSEAQSAASNRMVVLRRDADRARAAADGLRIATEQAMRDAATSHAACTERAHTLSVVLNQCGAAYQELGAVADRHASDVQTLMAAWPR